MRGTEVQQPVSLENSNAIEHIRLEIESVWLDRTVISEAFFPGAISPSVTPSLLLMNDGQHLTELDVTALLEEGYHSGTLRPLVVIGIHAGPERKREYGTAAQADYLGRGDKANAYTQFVFRELLPAWRKALPWSEFREKIFAGFSLGGLSALDIVWAHPHEFTKVGVFSGSFWWRSLDQDDAAYNDNLHRIMHQMIRKGNFAPWLQFFFETGSLDETNDRNGNGIIDSIDDTCDLITELKTKGYPAEQIAYLEIADGKHDITTWSRAMPAFLRWAFAYGQ
ncbi:alpha/beta hydrolase [Flavihumibacter petaseus]|uniref:Putative esterase n=1 Tax=Flavihumibacter petaseus NBRC 106054 TaxID=1220578 RepID=A0A0E9N0X1_9BACT|nr:alpha/beta hydrolase-fold protein [Flavihumibacter petaseus]GAO43296.1 putative esterase [Flavihumibacter petaseus NBRC 106054]